MTRKTFRQLLGQERPILLPAAHDALAARLIELAGFSAYGIGGFPLIGCRYALADVGVASFADMVAGVRDVMMGSSLPVLVDADDGYGDVKNVTRTVQTYEAMGVDGIVLEDQVAPKRCGHMAGKAVVDVEVAVRKLEAAAAARARVDMIIVARTDARAVHGLDDALRRGERFFEAGADAVFVEAPASVAEIETIGARLAGRGPLLINMAEGGRTPLLPPARLAELGFAMVLYPSTFLLRIIRAMRDGLEGIKSGRLETPPGVVSFAELTAILGIERWAAVDDAFGESRRYT
jgi:2-methylisocitrate lyase-like PEP mutase family enzyme